MYMAHKHENRLNLICNPENASLNLDERPFKSVRWAKTSKSNKTSIGEVRSSRDSSAAHEMQTVQRYLRRLQTWLPHAWPS